MSLWAVERESMSRAVKQPVVLVKWFRVVMWVLDRVDHFPKNQRFVTGQRLADRAISALELLAEASWSREKPRLLAAANRDSEAHKERSGASERDGRTRRVFRR